MTARKTDPTLAELLARVRVEEVVMYRVVHPAAGGDGSMSVSGPFHTREKAQDFANCVRIAICENARRSAGEERP